ncbi:PREDICTED: protein KRBA1 [Elephantulus edwardii]|uniref:protein KRBA1 n=1 Tax=Elephantulus edwardii TaxID=28737 RepID=UPI0003F0D0EF|nr:PREDICTED: protein KRBA1 [Elephantulus edwardii]
MQENYAVLASLGTAERLPLSAFLSPTEPEGTMRGADSPDEEPDPHGRGGSWRGPPRCSLPLSALVQLVKGIPEFLFREVPESSGDSSRESPAGLSPGSSPLQGLIDCLREILVPGSQHPEVPPSRLRSYPTLSSWRLPGLELGSGQSPQEVKMEAAPETCVLQGRLDHPKALEICHSHPSLLGAGQLAQREEPWAQERDSGASRASSSPLEALEACLKGIPLNGSSAPQPPTTSWSWGPQQRALGSPRPELRPHGRHSTGPATKLSPLHCLENFLEGMLPVQPLRFACLASPSSSPSPSSSEEEEQKLEPKPGTPSLQGSTGPSHTALKQGQRRPCQLIRPAHGPDAWKPRDLELGCGSPPVTANFEGAHLTTVLPKSPLPIPGGSSWPPCSCRDLQQELHSLRTILSGKLDWLTATLASLSQDMVAIKDQVNRLRRHPQGHRLKGWGSWRRSSAYRCPPYRRPTGPSRPRPKLLRGPGEGGSTGPPMGKRPPPGTSASSAIPSGSTCGCIARTVQPPKSSHPSEVPSTVSPRPAPLSEAIAAMGPPHAVATPATILTRPLDIREGQVTVPKGFWGGMHRDPRWGPLSFSPVLLRMPLSSPPPPEGLSHSSIPASMEPFSPF